MLNYVSINRCYVIIEIEFHPNKREIKLNFEEKIMITNDVHQFRVILSTSYYSFKIKNNFRGFAIKLCSEYLE